MQSAPAAHIVIDGRTYLYFGGTGYLGLQADPRVIDAACDALRRYGVHSATSRASIGTNPATLAVEQNAANEGANVLIVLKDLQEEMEDHQKVAEITNDCL